MRGQFEGGRDDDKHSVKSLNYYCRNYASDA